MSNPRISNITDLKRHAKAVGNSFFSKGNARYFGSSRNFGIYRQPFAELSEGYIVAEAIFTASDGSQSPAEYNVYRFEATETAIEWHSIGKHSSLRDAVAFLRGMGAVK